MRLIELINIYKQKPFSCVFLCMFFLLNISMAIIGANYNNASAIHFAEENNPGLVTEVETYDKNSSFTGTCRDFLGFTSWDCGVDIKDEDSLKKGLGRIAVNILTDITVLAAYLVLGYVIYGGYLYMFSAGDTNKTMMAKKTLSHAFIGLAIVMSAFMIMSTIRFALLNGNSMENCATKECVSPSMMITTAIQWAIGIGGSIALIFVVYGGILYITSAGDPSKLQKAKSSIIYALIGLAVVALAEVIVAFVTNMIRSSMV